MYAAFLENKSRWQRLLSVAEYIDMDPFDEIGEGIVGQCLTINEAACQVCHH